MRKRRRIRARATPARRPTAHPAASCTSPRKSRERSRPAAVSDGAYGWCGGAIHTISRRCDCNRTSAGSVSRISPMPSRSSRSSVSAACGQPRPGSTASSAAKPDGTAPAPARRRRRARWRDAKAARRGRWRASHDIDTNHCGGQYARRSRRARIVLDLLHEQRSMQDARSPSAGASPTTSTPPLPGDRARRAFATQVWMTQETYRRKRPTGDEAACECRR